MATWTDITAAQTEVDSPYTSELATAWTENDKALAEGASGAPRLATKNLFDQESGTGNVDFTVTDQGGSRFFISGRNNGASDRLIQINASDGSFGANQSLFTIPAGETIGAHGYVDFATGDFSCAADGALVTGTLTVVGAITTLRFVSNTDCFLGLHVMPDGGESAS